MDNLNKENFWDALHDQYPEAVEHFCKWIDDYKREVGWDILFGGENVAPKNIPKFHDIPFDMQNGILARYELELFNNGHGRGKEIYQDIKLKFKDQIKNLFADLQSQITKRKAKLN
jgi:hypothetical protein